MTDKTLGAYTRYESSDCTAERGAYVCTREYGHPGPHIAATCALAHSVGEVWDESPDLMDGGVTAAVIEHEAGSCPEHCEWRDAHGRLVVTHREAVRRARDAEERAVTAEQERDGAWAELDELRRRYSEQGDALVVSYSQRRPLSPKDITITDEMVQRVQDRMRQRGMGFLSHYSIRELLIAALTEPPARPDGAEEIEAYMREIVASHPGDHYGALADHLASRGVRVTEDGAA